MLEKEIEQKFLKLLKKAIPGIRAPKLTMMSQRSWPDRIIPLPNGKILFIEFKRPGEKPTPLQEDCHEYLEKLGHDIKVFDDAEEALRYTLGAWDAIRKRREV